MNKLINWFIISSFFYSMTLITSYLSIKITKFVGPRWIQSGAKSVQVLDCPFTLHDKEQIMEIKWLYLVKNIQVPIYQWIPGNKPQEIHFKGHIDTTYKASEDRMSKHRALAIIKPTTELTGQYTCRVSSFLNEDYKQQNLIIYSPARRMELTYFSTAENMMAVLCRAEDLFPEPLIRLHADHLSNLSSVLENLNPIKTRDAKSGHYRVSIQYKAFIDELSEDGQTFGCTIAIPGTNYSIQKDIFVNKDRIPASSGLKSIHQDIKIYTFFIFCFFVYSF